MNFTLPESIGEFVVNNATLVVRKPDGNYYQYSDVCNMMEAYAKQKLDEYKDTISNRFDHDETMSRLLIEIDNE